MTVIVGCGAYLPNNIVTNDDLAQKVETSHNWIVQRTGIHQRHIADTDEMTSDMAAKAAQNALNSANLTINDIDGIIVATTTPDMAFPATAAHVQRKLGMKIGPCFDVQAVCSGFLYGLGVADSMIKNNLGERFLLIGAEKMSSLLDWDDRTTSVLFGDGAGAVILEKNDDPTQGILSNHLYAEGQHASLLYTKKNIIQMQGREVFKHAVTRLSEVVEETLKTHNLTGSDIDWLVPHQANARIIESTAKKLNMSMDKVILTLANHANTSAASVPLALTTGVNDGRIKRGDLILLEAMGGGLTWGASLVRF